MNDDDEEERPRARLRAVERFRFGDNTVTDTSFNNTTFGPPRPAPRVNLPRRGSSQRLCETHRAPPVGQKGEENFPWHVPR